MDGADPPVLTFGTVNTMLGIAWSAIVPDNSLFESSETEGLYK
jgi:hypothetical protein